MDDRIVDEEVSSEMAPHWLIEQRWDRMLFAHWRVDPAALKRLLPCGAEPDVGFGSAWVGIVAFVMTGTRAVLPLHFPALPPIPELNLRTYVRVDGVPGVWFLSLDATSPLFVNAGHALYGLNYRRARMLVVADCGSTYYASVSGGAAFVARYRPVAAPETPAPGSLAHFLVERYRFFAKRHGTLMTAEVEHEPWRLQAAEAEIAVNRMAVRGLALDGEPVLHVSAGVQARISAPERVVPARLSPIRASATLRRRR